MERWTQGALIHTSVMSLSYYHLVSFVPMHNSSLRESLVHILVWDISFILKKCRAGLEAQPSLESPVLWPALDSFRKGRAGVQILWKKPGAKRSHGARCASSAQPGLSDQWLKQESLIDK